MLNRKSKLNMPAKTKKAQAVHPRIMTFGLPHAEMAMNSAPIAHTDFSPFMLNYGHDPCLIEDVFDQVAHETVATEEPFIFMKE